MFRHYQIQLSPVSICPENSKVDKFTILTEEVPWSTTYNLLLSTALQLIGLEKPSTIPSLPKVSTFAI